VSSFCGPPPSPDFSIPPSLYPAGAVLGVVVAIPVVLFGYAVVPPVLLALLPGVITAAAVFLVDVRPQRRSARAFGICLAASLFAGVLGPASQPAVSVLADAASLM